MHSTSYDRPSHPPPRYVCLVFEPLGNSASQVLEWANDRRKRAAKRGRLLRGGLPLPVVASLARHLLVSLEHLHEVKVGGWQLGTGRRPP